MGRRENKRTCPLAIDAQLAHIRAHVHTKFEIWQFTLCSSCLFVSKFYFSTLLQKKKLDVHQTPNTLSGARSVARKHVGVRRNCNRAFVEVEIAIAPTFRRGPRWRCNRVRLPLDRSIDRSVAREKVRAAGEEEKESQRERGRKRRKTKETSRPFEETSAAVTFG